ncbi:hypothetical protein BpHYR1_011809 [Brachionus plicatilis]|uniref:Uncharacterized protein n=1 Tax=Brachionus plicatilis TaxID=10195 RepID=A0A3M7R5Q8_BRAPC|nr:hypothetical protein BpHYR1_011809 [Brachionus plicatilis]
MINCLYVILLILVDLDALIPNICVFFVLEKSEESENNSIKSKKSLIQYLKCRLRLKLYHNSQNYLVYCMIKLGE